MDVRSSPGEVVRSEVEVSALSQPSVRCVLSGRIRIVPETMFRKNFRVGHKLEKQHKHLNFHPTKFLHKKFSKGRMGFFKLLVFKKFFRSETENYPFITGESW